MTAQFKPKNLLEYYMNEHSAALTAQKIAQEKQAVVGAEAPPMREVRIKDQTGRTITTWEGRASWLQDFGMAPKKVVAINTR